MVSIKPTVPFIWIPDSNVDKCCNCKCSFHMFKRKHHCRFCGKIFCYSCLPCLQIIPSVHDRYIEYKHEMQKCCYDCNEIIINIDVNRNKHIILSLISLNIKELEVFLFLNKQWNKAANFVLSSFKGIQYKLTYHRWTRVERALVKTHFNEMRNHSRLIIQSLKCLYGSKIKLPTQSSTCNDLYCYKFCNKQVSVYDLVDLVHTKPKLLEYPNVLNWVLNLMKRFKNDQIVLFLPWFLNIGFCKGAQLFIKSLLPRCADINFAYKFYFECKMLLETNDFYKSLIQKMFIDSPFQDDILKTERFIQSISANVFQTESDVKMPYDPNIIVKNIYVKNIKIINSYTKPVKIPMETNRGIKYIIVKKEDTRPDRLANLMMFLMNQYNDFNFKPYNVFCVSANEGWIEMLDNVETLYNIQKTSSIQNYILKHNQDKNIKELRRTFIKSCASNCILTYILGVGDRNLCNILIDKDGSMIHIDYSYILGHDPKWQEVQMRITPGMLDMLGGKDSIEYEQFKCLCTSMYKEIREYSFFWSSFIQYIGYTLPKTKYHGQINHIKHHIEQRLMLNCSSEEINMFIVDTVEKNSGSGYGFYDTMYHVRSKIDEYMFDLEI